MAGSSRDQSLKTVRVEHPARLLGPITSVNRINIELRYGLCGRPVLGAFQARVFWSDRWRNYANCFEHRGRAAGVNWQRMGPARNQRFAGEFHERASALGGARRDPCFRGDCWVAVGEPET